jgi:DNA polymerase-1
MNATRLDAMKLFFDGQAALAKVEANGIKIDEALLEKSIRDVDAEMASLKEDLKKTEVWRRWESRFGTVKLGSLQNLATVLFEDMGFKPHGRTATGKYAMTDEVLSKIDTPFASIYTKIKKLDKIKSTYLLGIKEELQGGFIHPSFNLNTVVTYRSSCSNPNTQNQPARDKKYARIVRQLVVPRKEGWSITELDLKGAEVVVAACYCKDPKLLAYVRDDSLDMHRDVAQQLFKVPDWNVIPDDAKKNVRFWGKSGFVFPEFYGAVWFQQAPILWEEAKSLIGPGGVPMREWLAQNGIKKLGKVHKRIMNRKDDEEIPETAKGTFEHHVKEIEKDFWKRRFKVYDQWKYNWYNAYLESGGFDTLTGFRVEGDFKKNEVNNSPIQGSAFHCLLWVLIELQKELKRRKMQSLIINEIHDSIILDGPTEEVGEVIRIANHLMQVELPKVWDWLVAAPKLEAESSTISWFDKKPWIEVDGEWVPKPEKPDDNKVPAIEPKRRHPNPEGTSIASYREEQRKCKLSSRQRGVMRFAKERAKMGKPEFTRADVKKHFDDDTDSYVPRMRELYRKGLLVKGRTIRNKQTGKSNNTWRIAK